MVVAIRFVIDLVTLLRDIHFAADHGVNAFLLGLVIELDRAEQVAMIGHGNGGHVLLHRQVHELGNLARPVEQRVIGMTMQVNKRRGHGGNPIPGENSSIAVAPKSR